MGSEPTTAAERCHDAWHRTRGSSCPRAFGESCFYADDLDEVGAEARATAEAQVAELRAALEALLPWIERHDSEYAWQQRYDAARKALAATPASSRFLDLDARPVVVCLCGSTRFAEEFNRQAEQLTLEGKIVVRPEVVAYSSANDPQLIAPEVKAALDVLHLRKIDLADEVFVLNVGGYIGESTRREIAYAERTGKPVTYLDPFALKEDRREPGDTRG